MQWLFGIIGSLIIALFSYLRKNFSKQKALENGVKALLHDKLFQECGFYTKQGWINYEEMENIHYIYNAYHGLNGNGTGTTAFEDVCKLPRHEVTKEKNENTNYKID